mmetsp:Transcript_17029/g.19102  ORF Transcript_17029/g.19102 Transcript_17029/m.19102 type:complete len:236 (+) Transcript_17029:1-708(+)
MEIDTKASSGRTTSTLGRSAADSSLGYTGQEITKLNEIGVLTSPSLNLEVVDTTIEVSYEHIGGFTVNYYLLDLEAFFSISPFLNKSQEFFRIVRPNLSQEYTCELEVGSQRLEVPTEYTSRDVMVEVVSGEKNVFKAYHPNKLSVKVMKESGIIQVSSREPAQVLSKVYIKVFADFGRRIQFYKDGYTDLVGKFDYLSLNTDQLSSIKRFAVLVVSDDFGNVIREVTPPSNKAA